MKILENKVYCMGCDAFHLPNEHHNNMVTVDSEDRPRRHKKQHYVKVLVFEVATDIQIREHKINFSDPSKRKWLAGLVVWATSNQKSIEIEAC